MLEPLFKYSQEFIRAKNQVYRRYFLAEEKMNEPFSILLGQRGVGKTTLIVQSLLDFVDGDFTSDKILYIQADHFLLGQSHLYEIADEFQLMGGKYLAFDEIHKYENWSMELKSICDSFPKLKLLASGSSALQIHKGSHDLSRRAIVYKIVGMSFREFLALNFSLNFNAYDLENIINNHQKIAAEITDAVREKDEAILSLFKKYLEYGYYPYYNELKDPVKFKITLEKNIHTTLESDLVSIHPSLTSHGIKKIKQLLSFIAQNVPYTPNWSNLKKFLEVGDERTLKNYLYYLEESGLIICAYKSSKLLEKHERPEKIYLQNPNLMSAISIDTSNIGTAREAFFYDMLSKDHSLTIPQNGDFLINNQFIFEIGGKKKSFHQIKTEQKAYVASDGIEVGFQSKIPLWLFGFLY